MDKKSEPVIGSDGLGEPIIDPAPDKPEDSPTWKAVTKGAKWGAVAGYLIGQLYISTNSPLGFYTGNVALVLLCFVGLGSALGAGIGWSIMQTYDDAPPPPSLPTDSAE